MVDYGSLPPYSPARLTRDFMEGNVKALDEAYDAVHDNWTVIVFLADGTTYHALATPTHADALAAEHGFTQ